MTRSISLLSLSSLLLSLLLMSGCQMDPEKSPAVAKLQEQVKKLEADQKKTKDEFDSFQMTNEKIADDVKTLKGKMGTVVSPDAAALADRVAKLEQQTKELADAIEAHKKPSPDVAVPSSNKTSDGAPTVKPDKVVTPKPPKGTAAATPRAETKSKGSYYQVKQGDTLQSVAQAHGISSADLCKANHLPTEATLYPAQQIYIPGK
jgi:LysM repeat protein